MKCASFLPFEVYVLIINIGTTMYDLKVRDPVTLVLSRVPLNPSEAIMFRSDFYHGGPPAFKESPLRLYSAFSTRVLGRAYIRETQMALRKHVSEFTDANYEEMSAKRPKKRKKQA